MERFSVAVAKEAIEKIPLQLLSRNLAQQLVMCRGESLVSTHSSCNGVTQLCAQLLPVGKAECRFVTGGLNVPCLLTFDGEKELLKKVRKHLEEIESKAHRVGDACSDDVKKR